MPDNPIHLRDVDAEYIVKFSKRMEAFWSDQDRLDQVFEDMDNLTNVLEVATKKEDSKARTLKVGLMGRQNKKEAAVIRIKPFTHFVPRGNGDDDIKLANRLEAYVAGAIAKSQKSGDSWGEVPRKGVNTGRAWEETTVDPSVWSTPEFKDQAQAIKDAPAGTQAEATKKLELMKADVWPIITREVPTRGTMTYFPDSIWCPEVIQIRKMSKEAIEVEWGPEALSEEHVGKRDSTNIDVLVYSNHKYSKTVVSGKSPQLVHSFDHDLGMNPVVLGEFVRAPESDKNIRWQPSAYHAKEMAETLDELLSDWRTAQRENTLAQPLILLDKEEYDEDEMIAGRPSVIDVQPGGPTIMGWKGEEFLRYPGPLMNEQATFFLQFVYQMVLGEMKTPVLEGDFKSGASNNLARGATQLAERELGPMVDAQRNMWEGKSKLVMRSVTRMNKEFPSQVDKLSVFDPNVKAKGFIEVGPDDVKGMEGHLPAPLHSFLVLCVPAHEVQLGSLRADRHHPALALQTGIYSLLVQNH